MNNSIQQSIEQLNQYIDRGQSPTYRNAHGDGLTFIVNISYLSDQFGRPVNERISRTVIDESGEPAIVEYPYTGQQPMQNPYQNQPPQYIPPQAQQPPQVDPRQDIMSPLPKLAGNSPGALNIKVMGHIPEPERVAPQQQPFLPAQSPSNFGAADPFHGNQIEQMPFINTNQPQMPVQPTVQPHNPNQPMLNNPVQYVPHAGL